MFRGQPDEVKPLTSEVEYLLETFSYYFPGKQLNNIIEQFAGLRVFPAGHSTAFHRSRDTIIQLDNEQSPKMASLYGGKLTAYRATAEKVMHRVLTVLPHKKRLADTRKLALQPADY